MPKFSNLTNTHYRNISSCEKDMPIDNPGVQNSRQPMTPKKANTSSQSQIAYACHSMINQSRIMDEPILNDLDRKSIMEVLKGQFQKLMALKETIKARPRKIDELKRAWRQKLSIIESQLNERIKKLTDENQALESEGKTLREIAENYEKELERQVVASAAGSAESEGGRIKKLESIIEKLKNELEKSVVKFNILQDVFKKNQQSLIKNNDKFKLQIRRYTQLQEQLQKKDEALNEANGQIKLFKEKLDNKDPTLNEANPQIKLQQERLDRKDTIINEANEQIKLLQERLDKKDTRINEATKQIKLLQEGLDSKDIALKEANQQIIHLQEKELSHQRMATQYELIKHAFQSINQKMVKRNQQFDQMKDARTAIETEKDQLAKKLINSNDQNQANLKEINRLKEQIRRLKTTSKQQNRPRSISNTSDETKKNTQLKDYFQLLKAKDKYKMLTTDELLVAHYRKMNEHQKVLVKNVQLEAQLAKLKHDHERSAQTAQNTIDELIRTQKQLQQQIQEHKRQIYPSDKEQIKQKTSLQLQLQHARQKLLVQSEQVALHAQEINQLRSKVMIEKTQKQEFKIHVQQLNSLNQHLRENMVNQKALQSAQKQINELRAIKKSYESKMMNMIDKPVQTTPDQYSPLKQQRPQDLYRYIEQLRQKLTTTQAEYGAMIQLYREEQCKAKAVEKQLNQAKKDFTNKIEQLSKANHELTQAKESLSISREGLIKTQHQFLEQKQKTSQQTRSYQKEIDSLKEHVQDLTNLIVKQDQVNLQNTSKIQELWELQNDYKTQIESLENTLREKDQVIQKLRGQLENFEEQKYQQIKAKANQMKAKEQKINQLANRLQQKSANQQSRKKITKEYNLKPTNFAAQILIKKPKSVQFLNSVIEQHTKASIDVAQIIYKKSLESKDLTRKMHQVLAEKTPLRAFLLLCRSRSDNECAIFCSKNDKDEIMTLLINLKTMQVFGPREGTSARAYSEKNGVSTVEFGEGAVRIQNSDSLVLQLDFEMMGAKYFEIENERDFTNESSKQGNLRMEEMELYQIFFDW